MELIALQLPSCPPVDRLTLFRLKSSGHDHLEIIDCCGGRVRWLHLYSNHRLCTPGVDYQVGHMQQSSAPYADPRHTDEPQRAQSTARADRDRYVIDAGTIDMTSYPWKATPCATHMRGRLSLTRSVAELAVWYWPYPAMPQTARAHRPLSTVSKPYCAHLTSSCCSRRAHLDTSYIPYHHV